VSSTPERYFLDTSVHLERWAGERRVREQIKLLLGDRTHASSRHALREWKRIVERGVAELLNVAEQAGGDVGEIIARLRQSYGRGPGQALLVMHLVTQGGPIDRTLEMRARRYLRYASSKQFHRQLDEVRDGSRCGLARNEVYQDGDGTWTLKWRCTKKEDICDHVAFLESDRIRASDAAQSLRSSARPADKRMGMTMEAMIKNPRDRKGRNCWGSTGDISIALEARPKEVILTTDESFDSIGRAIGLRVERIKPTRGPLISTEV
jgi:hypothetical protein